MKIRIIYYYPVVKMNIEFKYIELVKAQDILKSFEYLKKLESRVEKIQDL